MYKDQIIRIRQLIAMLEAENNVAEREQARRCADVIGCMGDCNRIADSYMASAKQLRAMYLLYQYAVDLLAYTEDRARVDAIAYRRTDGKVVTYYARPD